MAIELATGYVSIVPSFKGGATALTSGMSNGLDDEGQKAGKRFGGGFASSLKPALALTAGTLGAAFAVDFAGDAISAASDLNETLSKSNTVFGESAGAVERWADDAAKSFGQSKQQALDAAGSFGNMFTQLGIGEGQAADMSKSMTELASDFASFHNADITEVLTAQQAAFRGEYDALQRFVPTINAAAVEQKALAMTGKTATKELTLQEKALATQALMMEGAGDAAGDFTRTSDGLANKQRIMAAQFEDVKAKLGTALLPVMTAVVSFVTDTLIPGFERVQQIFSEEGLGGLVSRLGDKFREVMPVIGSALGEAGSALIDWVTTNAPIWGAKLLELGQKLVDWVQPQILPLLAELANLIGEIGEWIIRDGIPLLVQYTGNLAAALVDWVWKDAIPGLLDALPGLAADVGSWILEEGVPAFIEFGKDLGSALIEGIMDSLGEVPDALDVINAVLGGEDDNARRVEEILEGRAEGGRVTAGTPYVVGERRAELFVPETNGTILPSVPAGGISLSIGQLFQGGGEDPVDKAIRELNRMQLLAGAP